MESLTAEERKNFEELRDSGQLTETERAQVEEVLALPGGEGPGPGNIPVQVPLRDEWHPPMADEAPAEDPVVGVTAPLSPGPLRTREETQAAQADPLQGTGEALVGAAKKLPAWLGHQMLGGVLGVTDAIMPPGVTLPPELRGGRPPPMPILDRIAEPGYVDSLRETGGHQVGQVLGAASGASVGGMTENLLTSPATRSRVGEMLSAVAKGAVADAAQTGVELANQNRLPTMQDAASLGYGMPLRALGGLGRGNAAAMANELSGGEMAYANNVLKAAGGSHGIRGPVAPPAVEARAAGLASRGVTAADDAARIRAAGGVPELPQSLEQAVVADAAGPLSDDVLAESKKLRDTFEETKLRYARSSAQGDVVRPQHVLDTTIKLLRKRMHESGDPLMFGSTGEFKEGLNKLVDVSPPTLVPRAQYSGDPNRGITMTVAEARKLGLRVSESLPQGDLLNPGSIVPEDKLYIEIHAKPHTAEKLEETRKLIQAEANFRRGQMPEADWVMFDDAVRRDRMAFSKWPEAELGPMPKATASLADADGRPVNVEVKGWAALHQNYSDALKGEEDIRKTLGIVGDAPTDADVRKQIAAAVARIGQGSQDVVAAQEALKTLAAQSPRKAEHLARLMDVGGLKAQQVLQSGTGRSGSMNINALRLVGQRLAPAGHKLGQAAPYISRGLSEGVRVLKPSDVTMRQLLGLGP